MHVHINCAICIMHKVRTFKLLVDCRAAHPRPLAGESAVAAGSTPASS
jgi:hypothetical protein